MLIDPPYLMIRDDLQDGRIVPFLGAGASLSGRPEGADWNEKNAEFLPRGEELAKFLAKYAQFPKDEPAEDLAKVASFFQIVGGRDRLVRQLANVFDRDYKPGLVHEFLAETPTLPLIVTTNYDDLIEQAFKAVDRPYHLVTYPVDRGDLAGSVLWWKPGAAEPDSYPPNKLPLALGEPTVIYKMHGSIDRTKSARHCFLITEEDYIDFLSRMTRQAAIPAQFKMHFRESSFLFLGYGLADWNLRVMLRNVKTAPPADRDADKSGVLLAHEPDLKSWAIQMGPSELDTALWQVRQVDICSLDLDEFIGRLREVMGNGED